MEAQFFDADKIGSPSFFGEKNLFELGIQINNLLIFCILQPMSFNVMPESCNNACSRFLFHPHNLLQLAAQNIFGRALI